MVWYPNYLNDRILAGYKAEVDLKVGYEMNQIFNISKISFYVNDKLTHCSPSIKKKQIAVGLVGASMMASTLLGPTSETAKFNSGPQTYPTSVVVVNPQSLVMDQADLVKTTERPEVVEVKSGDPQSPLGSGRSGRSNGKVSRPVTPSPKYRSTHVNPYRTPPKIQTGNPGNPGKTEINEGSRREIVGYIRKGDTRIFYEEFVDGVNILGITTKGNDKQLNQIGKLVNELYPSLDINYKNL